MPSMVALCEPATHYLHNICQILKAILDQWLTSLYSGKWVLLYSDIYKARIEWLIETARELSKYPLQNEKTLLL